MKRSLAVVLLGLAAAATAAEDLSPLGVWIDKPMIGESVYGPSEIAVAVESQERVAVEIRVDGEAVGTLYKRPYRLVFDFGYDNIGHEIEVVVRTPSGRSATASVTTEPIHIDELIDLPLQQLYVTVTETGKRVLGLRREHFWVMDAGDRQEIVTFERGDVPLTAVLLLDCSLSMKGDRLAAARHGAGLFLENMQPLDEAMVMLFSDRLLRETEFTTRPASLRPSLENVEAAGGTALNDHLFMALKKLDTRQGRRVVVVFTDGSDVHSVLPMQKVLMKAQISQALVYWIHLQDEMEEDGAPRYTSAWRDVDGNREEFQLLRRAIQESGGRVRPVRNLDELGEAFVEILAELREQYVLGYYPTDNRDDGSWHDVKVKVRKPGMLVRTREGYLDY